jgi:5-oxoprolinase (ATP-hydrolysing)
VRLDVAVHDGARVDGGEAGKPGRNAVRRADGRVEELGSTARTAMAAGDAFIIETPGGGGFGKRDS